MRENKREICFQSPVKKSPQDGILFYGYLPNKKPPSTGVQLEQRGIIFIANVFHAGCTGQIVSQTLERCNLKLWCNCKSGGVGLIENYIAARFCKYSSYCSYL